MSYPYYSDNETELGFPVRKAISSLGSLKAAVEKWITWSDHRYQHGLLTDQEMDAIQHQVNDLQFKLLRIQREILSEDKSVYNRQPSPQALHG